MAVGTFAVSTVAASGSCGAGVSGPQAGGVASPSVSGVRLASAWYGARFAFRVKAPVIGVAALSFWFIGWMPRICSTVRTIVIRV